MFYEPRNGHGLPHDPFRAIVAPRPIGWLSTLSVEGHNNLAPYSFFNAVCGKPPMVGFASEGMKDSATNAKATGEFVVNLATRAMAEQVNLSSTRVDPHISEFDIVGLEAAPSHLVKPPRVRNAPAALECKVTQIVTLHTLKGEITDRTFIIGEVVGVYIDEHYLTDGLFDIVKAGTISRLGYRDYAQVESVFSMLPPASVFADH